MLRPIRLRRPALGHAGDACDPGPEHPPGVTACGRRPRGLPTSCRRRRARDGRARKNALEAIRSEKRAVLLYEAPHRLKETLADLAEYMPERNVAVIKDISKLYESVTTCALADAAEIFEGEIKGEYAILLEQQPEEDERAAAEWTSMPVEEHIRLYIDSGFSKMDAIKKVAKDRGMKKGEVYNLAYDIKNPSGQ